MTSVNMAQIYYNSQPFAWARTAVWAPQNSQNREDWRRIIVPVPSGKFDLLLHVVHLHMQNRPFNLNVIDFSVFCRTMFYQMLQSRNHVCWLWQLITGCIGSQLTQEECYSESTSPLVSNSGDRSSSLY